MGGPRVHGGEIVFQGTPTELLRSEPSLTGKYLSGRQTIPLPKSRRTSNGSTLVIEGAGHNNLKDIRVEIPLGTFTCVTGVSGSGKSSLINEILFPALAQKLTTSRGKSER
jgi:excinuclease ABC subunit A